MMAGEGGYVPAIDIQLAIESEGWPAPDVLEASCRATIDTASAFLTDDRKQPFPADGCELSLLFTDDASIRAINRQWRDRDRPTNVLSFPAAPLRPGDLPGVVLGDILLARETICREAAAQGLTFDNHLTHLLVHGFLHLFGYDHDSEREARVMEGLETRILALLDLSDPYENSDPA